jgi:DNA polymerase III gamma/tau subunit
MLTVAAEMDARSLSFDSALQELATLFHRIALVQFAPEAIVDEAERARLASYAQRLDAEFLQLCYQIAINGRSDLSLAPGRVFRLPHDPAAPGRLSIRRRRRRLASLRRPNRPPVRRCRPR